MVNSILTKDKTLFGTIQFCLVKGIQHSEEQKYSIEVESKYY